MNDKCDHRREINDSWATERFGCSKIVYINIFEEKRGSQKREKQEMREISNVSQRGMGRGGARQPTGGSPPFDRARPIAGMAHGL